MSLINLNLPSRPWLLSFRPGLAIAERLIEFAPESRVLFLCSQRPIDAHMLRAAGVEWRSTPAQPLSVRPVGCARFLMGYARTRRQCLSQFRERRPDHVLALGGFVSAPVVSAARSLSISTTLLNLDDPPGRANRYAARFCDRVWSAIELPDLPKFAERITGLPVRRGSLATSDQAECRRKLGLEPDLATLLITGASQGAASINRLAERLVDLEPGLFRGRGRGWGWQVLHLSGHGGEEALRAMYADAGVRTVVEPFLDEMGPAWGAADLAISRAGANSVAEIAANCVPTVFLPYPHHRDQHQSRNARPLVEIGGAVVVEDGVDPEVNARRILPVLRGLMDDRAARETMRSALNEHRPGDAAYEIATRLLATGEM